MRIHMTNIQGLGAVVLVKSLLPEFFGNDRNAVSVIYASPNSECFQHLAMESNLQTKFYRRWTPNWVSRFFEVTLFSSRFAGQDPILVLGDLPLHGVQRQTVFVQNSFLTSSLCQLNFTEKIRVFFLQWVFRFAKGAADQFIVQSEHMACEISVKYSIPIGEIHVVPQPVPNWLNVYSRGRPRTFLSTDRLNLFYPARNYTHKNHRLLTNILKNSPMSQVVSRLVLTIDEQNNPASHLDWVDCVGEIGPVRMNEIYSTADALLFLSSDESFGFPLLEAMQQGLPIICPNLPYAHSLCGSEAIFFDTDSIESLENAVSDLHSRLSRGWQPDWSFELKKIPKSWAEVAKEFSRITNSRTEGD